MTLTELPWLFMGRRIRPYALGVSLSTFVISWTLLVSRNGPGAALDRTFAGQTIGILGFIAVVMLWWGFWRNSDRVMETGLLLTSGAWFARAVFIIMDVGWTEGAFLSFCWVLISVGAFLLEHMTGAAAIRRSGRV